MQYIFNTHRIVAKRKDNYSKVVFTATKINATIYIKHEQVSILSSYYKNIFD